MIAASPVGLWTPRASRHRCRPSRRHRNGRAPAAGGR
jgi:hypothetical protein